MPTDPSAKQSTPVEATEERGSELGGATWFDDLWRRVNGALKCTIDAHGPITKDNYGNAGKRIAKQLVSDAATSHRISPTCICGKAKDIGADVCWHCFKHRDDVVPLKYFGGSYEEWVSELSNVPVSNAGANTKT
jgi:hypothetical protein